MFGAPADVTAADIQRHPDVEILNPEAPIATLNKAGRLAVDITVARGRGYVSAEENKEMTAAIGVIPVDSIYSPVRRVSFNVEATRVEQSTDFDLLVLDVETDGSISPTEALASAGATLRSLIELVQELSDDPRGLELGEVVTAPQADAEAELMVDDLELTERPPQLPQASPDQHAQRAAGQDPRRPAGHHQLRREEPRRGHRQARRAGPVAARRELTCRPVPARDAASEAAAAIRS